MAFGLLTLLRPDPLLRVRWPIALVAGLPLVQLLPLGSYREYLLSDSQLSLLAEVAAAGIEPFSSLTIYPHAPLQAAVVMAGCCGLFILSRALASRSERSFLICVAAVFAIGVVESAIGLEQYLRAQVEDGGRVRRRARHAGQQEPLQCSPRGMPRTGARHPACRPPNGPARPPTTAMVPCRSRHCRWGVLARHRPFSFQSRGRRHTRDGSCCRSCCCLSHAPALDGFGHRRRGDSDRGGFHCSWKLEGTLA